MFLGRFSPRTGESLFLRDNFCRTLERHNSNWRNGFSFSLAPSNSQQPSSLRLKCILQRTNSETFLLKAASIRHFSVGTLRQGRHWWDTLKDDDDLDKRFNDPLYAKGKTNPKPFEVELEMKGGLMALGLDLSRLKTSIIYDAYLNVKIR